MTPGCTIAIPVYTRQDARLNHVALESALEHAPAHAEILVVDDCSTTETWESLLRYRDRRLRLVRNDRNLGLFGNFNRCLELAEAPLVRILCTDDRLETGALDREIDVFRSHPRAVVMTTRGVRVTTAGHALGSQADHLAAGRYEGAAAIAAVLWFKAHYGLNPLNYPSGVLLSREVAVRAGGFDTSMRMAGDVDLFLRMLRFGDLIVVPSVGCLIGVHADQEGAKLSRDVRVMDEDFALADRHRDVLDRLGVYGTIRRQFGGVALGLAQRCARDGDLAGARRFVASARAHGVSRTGMVVGLGKLAALRALLRVGGVRRTFGTPAQPL